MLLKSGDGFSARESHHGEPGGWEPPNHVHTQHVVSVPPGHSHRPFLSRVVQTIECEAHSGARPRQRHGAPAKRRNEQEQQSV